MGLSLSTHTHTQLLAQQPKWVVNNSVVDPVSGQVTVNPFAYAPEYTQNAFWDKNGAIKFYAEDGVIYNKVGQQLVPDPNNFWWPLPIHRGHSEFIFVPVPGSCTKLYTFSIDTVTESGSWPSYLNSGSIALVYSILDIEANNGNGGADVVHHTQGVPVKSNYIKLNAYKYKDVPQDKLHIGATRLQPNGKRYLFISGLVTLRVFEVSSGGIIEIMVGQMPIPGNKGMRSELEISEDANHIRVAFPWYYESKPSGFGFTRKIGGFDIFTFTKPNQQNDIPSLVWRGSHTIFESVSPDSDVDRELVKGIEFSPDGKHLYITRIKIHPGQSWEYPSSIIPTYDMLHYYRQPSQPHPGQFEFYKQSNIPLDPNGSDFSFGMLEVDNNGGLCVAGMNRIGKLVDANDPGSTFIPNAITGTGVNLTNHNWLDSGYFHASRMLYLLPDQVDGEDFDETFYFDQFPETLTVCSIPYTLTSSIGGTWTFSYLVPHSEPSVYRLDELGYSTTVQLNYTGTATITYESEGGCEITENVHIQLDPISVHGADFTYQTYTDLQGLLNIELTPLVSFGITSEWTLYKNMNGSWVYVSSMFSQPNSLQPEFTGLNPQIVYRVKHEIVPDAFDYPCKYSPSIIKNIK